MKTIAIRHLIAVVACLLSGILTSNAAKALSTNSMDIATKKYEAAGNPSSETNSLRESDFVAVGEFGPYLLDEETLVRELKSKGFSVETFGPPADAEDDMAVYIMLKATRNDRSNPAVVMLINGEDRLLAIGLSDSREIEAFAKELRNKNYREENGIFFHPDCNMSKIAVKFSGNQIHIIQPFEMVPDDF